MPVEATQMPTPRGFLPSIGYNYSLGGVVMSGPAAPPVEFHCADFSFAEHAIAIIAMRPDLTLEGEDEATDAEAASAPPTLPPPDDDTPVAPEEAGAWDAFYVKNRGESCLHSRPQLLLLSSRVSRS